MDIQVHLGEAAGGIDWASWVQAVGSLIAVVVTAAQWRFAHQQLEKERLDRVRSVQVAYSGVYVALRGNIDFLRQEHERAGPDAAKAFAAAMLSGGTALMQKTIEGVNMRDVPSDNVDAVMSAQTVFHGTIQALTDVATSPTVNVDLAVDYLVLSVKRFREALLLMKPAIPAGVLDGQA